MNRLTCVLCVYAIAGILSLAAARPAAAAHATSWETPGPDAPMTSQQIAAAPKIPMIAGLSETKTSVESNGDRDIVLMITKVDPQNVTYSLFNEINGQQSRGTIIIRQYDIMNGAFVLNRVPMSGVVLRQGTLAQGPSASAFKLLKQLGSTSWVSANLAPQFSTGPVQATRVGKDDVALQVIVNDKQVDLPAVHVKCKAASGTFDMWILDDEAYPMQLLVYNPTGPTLITKTTKISFPLASMPNPIKQRLATSSRAVTYGIYFDFGSAALRPESTPVLAQIADSLKSDPQWKLTIEGHTDNVGGDVYNLGLSKRRAAAVKDALVTQYGIAADRLSAVGYGASRPKASNATVSGRALNRRVELVRKSGG